jgi:hypothetical protein
MNQYNEITRSLVKAGQVLTLRQLGFRRSYLEHLEHQEHGQVITKDDILDLRISLGSTWDVNEFLED